MSELSIGVLLWNMAPDWPTFERAARRVDELGYDHIWTWDHLHAIFGEPQQPVFDGWMALGGLGKGDVTSETGAVSRRQHVPQSGTRGEDGHDARSHERRPSDPGPWRSVVRIRAQRPRHRVRRQSGQATRVAGRGGRTRSEPSSTAARRLQSRTLITRSTDLRQEPLPIQQHLPIMIGGSGERKTLRTVAKYADMWNMSGPVDKVQHKMEVLDQHCADVGRDPAEIERTISAASSSCATPRRRRASSASARWRRTRRPWPRSRTTTRFWFDTPEQDGRAAAGLPRHRHQHVHSRDCRRRTTTRRSSG